MEPVLLFEHKEKCCKGFNCGWLLFRSEIFNYPNMLRFRSTHFDACDGGRKKGRIVDTIVMKEKISSWTTGKAVSKNYCCELDCTCFSCCVGDNRGYVTLHSSSSFAAEAVLARSDVGEFLRFMENMAHGKHVGSPERHSMTEEVV